MLHSLIGRTSSSSLGHQQFSSSQEEELPGDGDEVRLGGERERRGENVDAEEGVRGTKTEGEATEIVVVHAGGLQVRGN